MTFLLFLPLLAYPLSTMTTSYFTKKTECKVVVEGEERMRVSSHENLLTSFVVVTCFKDDHRYELIAQRQHTRTGIIGPERSLESMGKKKVTS